MNGKTKKALATGLCAVAIAGASVFGTLAWLTDKTDPIQNTFTVGNVDITLAETTGPEYKMIPGYTLEKDPTVTVKANSEKSYVFVKVEKSNNFDEYMTYDMANGWTALDGVDGVYYREVESSTEDQEVYVLKSNQVTVKSTVTKELMDAAENSQPTLTFTAYACQYNKDGSTEFTAVEAWNTVNPTATE